MILKLRDRVLTFPRRPLVMGIVNVNDDSFCGDGTLDPLAALGLAQQMAADGADFIDAGAESARTNRAAISVEEEVRRLTEFVRAYQEWAASVAGDAPWFDAEQMWPPLLSLNTWRPEVVAAVLPLGGDLVNDIGALPDGRNAELCARHGAALLVMHSVGLPKEKHTHVGYPDIMAELDRFFREKLELCATAGLAAECVVLDPGIDFAKQKEDNLTIFREAEKLEIHGRPVLWPVSRKTVIGEVLGLDDPLRRDAGTLACVARVMGGRPEGSEEGSEEGSAAGGAVIFRVHAVRPVIEAVKVLWAVNGG